MKDLFIALAFCAIAVVAFTPGAAAAPCCESCEGWEEGEPPPGPDYCWDNCVICGGGGPRCQTNAECSSSYWQCINGYCVFVGAGGLLSSTVSETCGDLEAPEKSEAIGAEAAPVVSSVVITGETLAVQAEGDVPAAVELSM